MSEQNIEFKDSGIPWIGQIPKHWEVKRLKYIATKIYKGNGITKEQVFENGDMPCVRYGEIYTKYNYSFDECFSYTFEKVLNSASYFGYGDILFTCIGEFIEEIGKNVVYLGDKKCLAGGDIIILNHKQNPSFLNYALDCNYARNQKSYGKAKLKVAHISSREISNLFVVLPPLNEQEKIAEFLDKKCEIIDKRLSNLERKIKSLKEYKKSLISECVTKGLNLKNMELKDSGIPWIGEIPKHWEIRPLYFYFNERKNKNLFENEKNLLSLSYGKIIRKNIETKDGLLPENFNGYNIIEKDDIVFRLTDLQNDKVSLRTGLVKEKGIITSAYVTIKPKQKICIEFYHYLLHCYDLIKVFYNFGNGVRQSLTYKELSKMKILVPPLNEQKEIAEFLDKKCEKIDRLNENYTKQITALKEYKKSLIYECVTGKNIFDCSVKKIS